MLELHMQPRDVFDGIIVSLWTVILYLELIGFGLSPDAVQDVKDGVASLGLTTYLVVGGFISIVFLGYMFLYLPNKLSQNPNKEP